MQGFIKAIGCEEARSLYTADPAKQAQVQALCEAEKLGELMQKIRDP